MDACTRRLLVGRPRAVRSGRACAGSGRGGAGHGRVTGAIQRARTASTDAGTGGAVACGAGPVVRAWRGGSYRPDARSASGRAAERTAVRIRPSCEVRVAPAERRGADGKLTSPGSRGK